MINLLLPMKEGRDLNLPNTPPGVFFFLIANLVTIALQINIFVIFSSQVKIVTFRACDATGSFLL
jgi:hypothetical protein